MDCRAERRRSPLAPLAAGVVAVMAGNVATGRILTAHDGGRVDALAAAAVAGRGTPARDRIGLAASWLTDVPRAVVITAGVVAATAVVSRDARRAALPGVATALASAMHVTVSLLVRRPRPAGERIGTEQLTTSYPSGHVGAATAQSLVLAGMASALPAWPRRAVRVGCAVAPLLVGWSRLYTGQHHTSDVLAGCVNGVVAAGVARRALGR